MTAPPFLILMALDLDATDRECQPVRANRLEEEIEVVVGEVEVEEALLVKAGTYPIISSFSIDFQCFDRGFAQLPHGIRRAKVSLPSPASVLPDTEQLRPHGASRHAVLERL